MVGGDVVHRDAPAIAPTTSPNTAAKAAILALESSVSRVSAENLVLTVTPKIARVSLFTGFQGAEPNVRLLTLTYTQFDSYMGSGSSS